jgi:NitT/TauT family transport system ATP-binding protein
VEGISLDVPAGTFLSVVGPSVCGKSTILNMAAGLMPPSASAVQVFGEPLTDINRRASCMFQQDALLPWKSILDNICPDARRPCRSPQCRQRPACCHPNWPVTIAGT